jgi:hypothetical protein
VAGRDGKTRAQVAEKLTKAMADRDSGVISNTASLTLGEYLRVWLENSVKGCVKQVTYEGYARMVHNYIAPALLGSVKLKNLTPPHLRRLYKEKLDSGLGTRSVQHPHDLAQSAQADRRRRAHPSQCHRLGQTSSWL